MGRGLAGSWGCGVCGVGWSGSGGFSFFSFLCLAMSCLCRACFGLAACGRLHLWAVLVVSGGGRLEQLGASIGVEQADKLPLQQPPTQ